MLCALILGLLVPPQAPAAQERDARVALPGTGRLQVGGVFSTFDARFGDPLEPNGDGRGPLRTPFMATLSALQYAPLQNLQGAVNAVLDPAVNGALQADPENLFLTTGWLHAGADHRRVPFGLEVGVLPRVSLGIQLPLTQYWLEANRFGIVNGTVGLNPDPAHNRAVLGAIGEEHAELGGGHLLPISGSEIGQALQERVREATGGQELRLPEQPVDEVWRAGLTAELPLQQTLRHTAGRPAWGMGDIELMLRVQLLNSPRTLSPVTAAGPGIRSALEVGARLPTGTPVSADYYVLPPPEEGVGGLILGVYNDLLLARRFGAGASVRWERLGGVEIATRSWQPAPPFPPPFSDDTLRWEAGNRLTIDVSPRFHLVDEIALVGRYSLQQRSGESFTPAGAEGAEPIGTAARSAQRWALGLEYSTLAAYPAGSTRVPFESALYFRDTFSGASGEPAIRGVEFYGRLFLRFWGRR